MREGNVFSRVCPGGGIGGGLASHVTPDMFKVGVCDHHEACMVGKRAVGILLERFLVQFETVLLESYYFRLILPSLSIE